jgi:uncharacterized protein
MSEHRNVQLGREGYEALASGDVEWIRDHLADDVVWHVGGNNEFSGDYRGKEEVLRLFRSFTETTDGPPAIDVHDVIANEDHIVGLVKQSLQRPDGETLETRYVQVFHAAEDGRVNEAWTFNEDQAAVDDFLNADAGAPE